MSIIHFLVVVCIILYLIIIVKEECIPVNAIIYRDENLHNDNSLNDYVKFLYVVKTGIYYSLYPSFGKNYFCHWSIMTETDKKMFIISPTGHGSINVHEVKREYIYKEKGYTFIRGGSLEKHIIFSQKIKPIYDITVNDVINHMMKINSSIKYLPFSMNCQFLVSYIISSYTNENIPKVSSLDSFKRIVNDFIFGYKF